MAADSLQRSPNGSQKPLSYGSLLHGVDTILSSIVPLVTILCCQPFFILGIAGLPTSWWDVLLLDLGLGRLLYEGLISTFFCVWRGIVACFRPTIPGNSPRWLRLNHPLFAWLFFSDEATVQVVDHCCAAESTEAFVYVNGMCNTKQMALNAGKELADMFNRTITVVHNPTDSAMVDLFECIIGKLWTGKSWSTIVPCTLVLDEIETALRDPHKTKVVLISHSQGTIIAGDVLWHLWKAVDDQTLTEAEMKKLEMYSFANAAHTMIQREGVPYMESICNQRDNVGMLGANAPNMVKISWGIQIEGKVIYPNKVRWGHMISSHYLKYIKTGDYTGSKLHEYINMARDTPKNFTG